MTASDRKQKTEKLLTSLGIPFNRELPLIEEENEVQIRSSQEIAKRLLILTYLCYVAEDQAAKFDVIEFLKYENLWNIVTNDEKDLFQKELTDKEKISISWRSEAIWLLLWAINKVDEIELPQKEVCIPDILEKLPKLMSSTKVFVETSVIKSTSDILDMSDLIYRLHWATRNSELKNSQILNLNPNIVSERHYSINWVTYYSDNWDDVTTDT